ncbi:hypothetical protein ACFVWG_04470 [Kribbella sp. NPDC058245]|uniref:hypothetical protein n=1 Tax=Kribbella sp. NPDC058245 TaxID=3346399 RepID=UPI0036EA31F1
MIRRTLAFFAVLAMLTMAAPAYAGGPTSVLLSAPPRVVALGYDDLRYSELQALTSLEGASKEPDSPDHQSGNFVRAAWLIHDMNVWRIDIIYPDAPGGPWIATSESSDGSALDGSALLGKPVWHRSPEPVALTKLLASLKLLPGDLDGQRFLGGPTTLDYSPPASPPVADAQPAPQPQAQVVATSVFTGWRWILPGVLVGAALAWAAGRFLRQRRWDLVDAD